MSLGRQRGHGREGAGPQQELTCESSMGAGGNSLLLLHYFQQKSEERHPLRIRLRDSGRRSKERGDDCRKLH